MRISHKQNSVRFGRLTTRTIETGSMWRIEGCTYALVTHCTACPHKDKPESIAFVDYFWALFYIQARDSTPAASAVTFFFLKRINQSVIHMQVALISCQLSSCPNLNFFHHIFFIVQVSLVCFLWHFAVNFINA